MLITNIVLIVAFVLMIAIAIGLSRDGSGKTGQRRARPQVRVIDADAEDER
ncbi:hypothetical protein [uncultured Thiohalocapsa sp.]|uniref:hypothetical protein n=1 Tax=uncultured Thiohalocapsa sp. TaxID=768990 RepID=UPI0025F22687|nr:hypothetical protein [uncultured Thiohalocapsa sp.]